MASTRQFNIVRRVERGTKILWLPVASFTLNDNERGVATLNGAEGAFYVFPSRYNSKGEYDHQPPEPSDRREMEHDDLSPPDLPEFATPPPRRRGYRHDPDF